MKWIGFLILVISLAGCCKGVSDICPDYLDPVCGDNGKTYSNSCYAERDGVRNYTSGSCKED